MAVYNFSIDVCSACRLTHLEKEKEVSCDDWQGICSKTNAPIDDPDEYMDLDSKEMEIVYLWERITSISRMERIDKTVNKEQMRYFLRSLDNMQVILNNTDWKYLHVTKREAIYYLQIFHSVYNNTVLG